MGPVELDPGYTNMQKNWSCPQGSRRPQEPCPHVWAVSPHMQNLRPRPRKQDLHFSKIPKWIYSKKKNIGWVPQSRFRDRIWMPVVYLGGDHRKLRWRSKEVRQKRRQPQCTFASKFHSWWGANPLNLLSFKASVIHPLRVPNHLHKTENDQTLHFF